ncbi:MAG: TonB-dependent receptor [bacterium]
MKVLHTVRLALALSGAPALLCAQSSTDAFIPIGRDTAVAALKTPVSIWVTRERLRTVVEQIASRAGIGIAFDDSLPGLDYSVTLHARNMSVREALERALDGTPLHAMVSASGLIVLQTRPPAPVRAASVGGTVVDSATGAPVEGARVELVGTRFATFSREGGRFALGTVPFGDYALRVTRIGYLPVARARVGVPQDFGAGSVTLTMQSASVSLAEVVVTPGYFGLLQGSLAAPQRMTREQLETVPQIGEDIYRAVTRLPGVSAEDFSAKFNVRGGSGDELYVSLDGLELQEPFHLRDLGGAFSIIDIQALGSASLTTGGFSADQGDRLTGVFTMRTVDPRTDRVRTSTGISLMNARITSQGGFANGKGGWLFSARPGYLDLALKLTDVSDKYAPRYYDVFGKAQYDLESGGRIAIHVLSALDDFKYLVEDKPSIRSRYASNYVWLTWEDKPGPRLRVESVASAGALRWRRNGEFVSDRVQIGFVDDARALTTLTLRQDWSLDASPSLLVKWGANVKRENARYDYAGHIRDADVNDAGLLRQSYDSVTAVAAPRGSKVGGYIAPRWKPAKDVAVELGVRYDLSTLVDESIVSPRLNVSWQPLGGTTLRAAWGRYTQSQAIFGLQVQDGINQFALAERAEQRVMGIDQVVPFGVTARVELYERLTTHRRPEFVSVAGDVFLLPELMFDRVRIDPTAGRDRGLEFMLSRSAAQRMDWSASYVLASSQDSIDGRIVPRGIDQRHAAHLDWSLHPASNSWRLSVGAVWHSGWPYTPTILTIDTLVNTASQFVIFPRWAPGELNSGRLPSYRRLDVRWTRYFDTARGRVSIFGELYNAFNSQNPRGYWKEPLVRGRNVTIHSGENSQFPRLPVAGFSWEF